MTILVRPLGYTGKLQQLTWAGTPATITAYAWGGGGGGGGNDSAPGGTGGGGGFAQGTFRVVDGDVIQVAVGGGGRRGVGGTAAEGGFGGFSYIGATSYYGGIGGDSGPTGSSGGGGGGGGATVILLNGVPLVIAGGGAGAGGGGNVGAATGQSGPGSSGSSGLTIGQNGTNKTGDGGGGGGGGGGSAGGNGGDVQPGDQGGLAGFYGLGLGVTTQNPSGRLPGNQSSSYYIGTPGVGGSATVSGTAGFANLEFNISGVYVKESGSFSATKSMSIRQNGVWTPIQSTWVKQNGIWNAVSGSFVPTFINVDGNFGGQLATCISVCDEAQGENTGWSKNQGAWDAFKRNNPDSPFYLLAPGGASARTLKVPGNFTPDNLGFGPIAVNRDNGNPAARSDWFAIANLSSAAPGSVVEVAIDNSGSMRFSTVSASYSYLVQQCNAAGIIVINRGMSKERWINPFVY
jgi:hypothetical protein